MQDTGTQHKHGLILFAITFLIAPFFFQPNLGGEGLSISHNATVWIAATLLMAAAVFTLLKSQRFHYPAYWLPLLALPLSVILCGFLVEIFLPYQFLLRELYILGGLLFLFALFQFRFSTTARESLLLILIISGALHALYGIIQIIWPGLAPTVITYSTGIPYSTFQQINLQASYQATTLISCLYLISRPRIASCYSLLAIVILVTTFLSSFIVAYSGSRVGLLSGLIGLTIILLCRWPQLGLRKPLLVSFIILVILGGFAGKEGLARTGTKLQETAEESLKDSRKNIYAIAFELFKEQPVQGYGIGSFQKEWHSQKVEYLARQPEANLPPERLSHPHNELMFWVVEGGMLVISGIIITLGAAVTAALKCGWRRGLSYLALLVPVSLHTQVELPFYISNIHWLLMMTLLFLILSHSRTSSQVSLSRAAILTAKTSAVAVFVSVTLFMAHSIYANNAIIRFLEGRQTEPLVLQPALENAFFRDQAELYFMRALLMRDIQAQQNRFAPQFIEWAEPFIEYTPVPQLYIDLAQAYLITDKQLKALDIINRGAAIYPIDKNIGAARDVIRDAVDATRSERTEHPARPPADQDQSPP